MANYDLTNLALKAAFPTNSILLDDKGLPSVMVYIPKFKISDVITGGADSIHPAFIVNGTEVDGIYISKYENVVNDGRAYSLPCEDPKASVTADQAAGYCAAKGEGWHLMTNAEWAAIALWCKKNAFLPYGNNFYGKDSRESSVVAIPSCARDSNGNITRVATGTGPVKWSHNQQPSGIYDLSGNVWEWCGGIRLVNGEVQILANNNAADSGNPQTAASTSWKAINATTGELTTPNGEGTTSGCIKLDYVSSKWTYSTSITSSSDTSRSCSFVNVTADATIAAAAKAVLQALCLLPDDTTFDYEGDIFYANNAAAERFVLRGGHWGCGAYAGIFSFCGGYPRSNSDSCLGFRSAFVQLPTV